MADRHTSGISCNRWIAFSWREQLQMVRSPERIAMVNDIAAKRLHTLIERETRERPQGELAYLETLMIEVLLCVKPTPAARSIRLEARGVEWIEESAKADVHPRAQGVFRMYPDPELPIEVDFLAEIEDVLPVGGHRRVRVQFADLSDPVFDLYQQLLFIYHRRAQRTARETTS